MSSKVRRGANDGGVPLAFSYTGVAVAFVVVAVVSWRVAAAAAPAPAPIEVSGSVDSSRLSASGVWGSGRVRKSCCAGVAEVDAAGCGISGPDVWTQGYDSRVERSRALVEGPSRLRTE